MGPESWARAPWQTMQYSGFDTINDVTIPLDHTLLIANQEEPIRYKYFEIILRHNKF